MSASAPSPALHRLAAALALLALLGAFPAQAREGDHVAGRFDYLTLALSWSPTFCGTPDGQREPRQCGKGRRFSFIVHGLWPQYRRGWPEFCDTQERWVPEGLIRSMFDIMPSKRLVIHEWKKHGTCSGLGQEGYFALTRDLFEDIKIPARYIAPSETIRTTPEQLVADFVKTNRQLEPEMLSVHCGNRRDMARLAELRICYSRKGEPAPCGANERRDCRARTLVMPPVRN